jgi:hypothetical protein
MKKFWLSIGLTLLITCCWCGAGYYGLGTGPAFGQDYYSPSLSCNPSDPSCYNDYYRAPYADPLSQLLYYIAPPVERDYRYEQRQHYQRQESKRERQDRDHRDRQQRDHQQRDRDHQRN